MTKKCIIFLICSVIAVIAVYFPTRHARHYDYIKSSDVINDLVLTKWGEATRNTSGSPHNLKTATKNCISSYQRAILNNSDVVFDGTYETRHDFIDPAKGGRYFPRDCNHGIKSAIIVPYRNRPEQLTIFLDYMHRFLQNQEISYQIFVVHQNDSLPFNRAKMLNYGAQVALKMGFPCLILHDVDLIPVSTGNLYGCVKRPRHMSSSLDTFRFNLPYLTLFGGAVAIGADQFKMINGMSNVFYGWGGEDDDFYQRLEVHNLVPIRFAPELSKYTMLFHRKEKPSASRFSQLSFSIERHRLDGLNSLGLSYTIRLEDLYTAIYAT